MDVMLGEMEIEIHRQFCWPSPEPWSSMSAALYRWATFNDDYSVGPGQGDWGAQLPGSHLKPLLWIYDCAIFLL